MKKTALALALFWLAGSASAAVVGKEVVYKAGKETMRGYLAWDDAVKGKRGGVLVVPEWWGVSDYGRKRARMLAQEGYIALMVDMYGDGRTAANPKDAGALSGAIGKDPKLALTRFRAAESFLSAQPGVKPGGLAALGYCFGGAVVLNMARAGEPLKAVASYHGILATETPAKPGAIKGKLAVFTGEADPFVPGTQVEAFRAEMAKAGVDMQLVAYPDVEHTFTNREADSYAAQFGLPLKYDARADADSWAKTLKFLEANLK